MTFQPPVFPTNFVSFLVLAGIFSGGGYSLEAANSGVGKPEGNLYVRLIMPLFLGCSGALALMAFMTSVGFIPDDWSASRLTWPGGLLCGYHLYMGNEGPSNGFFYPPVGAWFYLPAAALGLLLHSPMVALIAGWSMSLFCIFAPIVLLLILIHLEKKRSGRISLVSFLIAVSLVFATPQLRYVATMVHVDAPAILFLGMSLVLILPIGLKDVFPIKRRMMMAGCSLALSVFCKQSVWPLVPALIAASFIWHGCRAGLCFFLGSVVTGVLVLGILLLVENGVEVYRMIWKWPSDQVVVTSVTPIIRQLFVSNIPIMGMLAILLLGLKFSSQHVSPEVRQSFIFLLGLAFWMIPFAVITRMRIGADWNHLAIPSYLALLALLFLFPVLISGLVVIPKFAGGVFLLILGMLAVSLLPYFSQNCGWYHWMYNSHEQALKYSSRAVRNAEKIYFPWQVFSTLIQEKKLYHLDDCLRYEESAGWKRPEDSIVRFLPAQPFKIAIRPFGAPSYIVQKEGLMESAPLQELPGWHIYQKN